MTRSLLRTFWRSQSITRKIGFWAFVGLCYVAASVSIDHLVPSGIDAILNSIADLSLLFVGLPAGVFYLGFLLFLSNWSQNPAGRSVAILGIALNTLFGVNASTLFIGQDYPGRPFIRDASYFGICAAMIYLCVVVVSVNVSDSITRLAARELADQAGNGQESVSA